MKAGFLLNHYDVHQVPHIVPFAFEMSRLYPQVQVDILSSTALEDEFAREIGAGYEKHQCRFHRLKVPGWVRLADNLLSKFFFLRKSQVLKANFSRFCSYDVLVIPEISSLALKGMIGFDNTKIASTGHGPGVAHHTSKHGKRIGLADLVLAPGRKSLEALRQEAHLSDEKLELVGYAKFEAMTRYNAKRKNKKLFDNDLPVVVYNPHHRRSHSSWHLLGEKVLDYFYASSKYNLIFAPHTLLFKRSWGKRGANLPSRFRPCDHIIIDTGSRASSDMTYMRAADIYLGDTSSQIYEFLETPRPCVFLDAHDTNISTNPLYRPWKLGPLICDPAMLEAALDEAVRRQAEFAPLQRAMFKETFDVASQSAGERGAVAIAKLIGATPPTPHNR